MSEYVSIVASRIPSLYQKKKYYLAVLVIGILKKFKILMKFLVFFFFIFCVYFIRPKILTNENCLIVLVESYTVKLFFFLRDIYHNHILFHSLYNKFLIEF